MAKLPLSASHGTINAYTNYSCRCGPCREAGSAYRSEARARYSEQRREDVRAYMREYMRNYRARKRQSDSPK
jgi:hypothetical protein